MRILTIGSLTVLGAICTTVPLTAQDRVIDADVVDEISVTSSTTLQSDYVISDPITVFQADDGTIVYVSAFVNDELLLFEADGRYRGMIGGAGDGPGEFRRIAKVLPGSDERHITVVDATQLRVTELDLEGTVQSTRSLAADAPRIQTGTAALDPETGALYLNAISPTPERLGHWVFLFGPEGEFEPVGPAVQEVPRSRGAGLMRTRRLAIDDSHLYVASRLRYEIEIFDRGATPTDAGIILLRSMEWFPGISDTEYLSTGPGLVSDDGPRVFLDDIWTSGNGTLWVSVLVPSPDAPSVPTGENYTEAWDTVVEVVDLATNRITARGRIDGFTRGFTNRGGLIRYGVDADGIPNLELLVLSPFH